MASECFIRTRLTLVVVVFAAIMGGMAMLHLSIFFLVFLKPKRRAGTEFSPAASCLSFIIPGFGQFLQGRTNKAVVHYVLLLLGFGIVLNIWSAFDAAYEPRNWRRES